MRFIWLDSVSSKHIMMHPNLDAPSDDLYKIILSSVTYSFTGPVSRR